MTSCVPTTSATTGTSACRASAVIPPTHPARTRPCRRCRSARAHSRLPVPTSTRLALVAGAQRDPLGALRRSPPVRATGHVHAGLQRRRQGFDRPDPLAAGARQRRPTRHWRQGHAHRDERQRSRHRALVARRRRTGALPGRERRRCRGQRDRHRRLLLLSSSDIHPDGLANSSGLVGTRLMMHPFGSVTGLFDDDLESWQGHFGCSIESFEFYETDERRGFVRARSGGSRRRAVRSTPPCRAAPASRRGDPTTTFRCEPASAEA